MLSDTFLRAYRFIGKFQFKSSFFTWLYRIATNTSLTRMRKRRSPVVMSLDESVGEDGDLAIEIPDHKYNPETMMRQRELRIVGSGVGEEMPRAAYAFRLDAHPNPATGRTTVRYELGRAAEVELAAFDRAGRRVARLASGRHERGRYAVAWECRDDAGRPLPVGVYFIRLETSEGRRVQKVVLNQEGR